MRPRLAFQQPKDVHLWGYTADKRDRQRAEALIEHIPTSEFPLIERGLTKQACRELLLRQGIKPPITYDQGFEHANCIPCPKASSPAYWALVRHHYPDEFDRMAELDDRFGAHTLRLHGKRVPLRLLPEGAPMSEPTAPECDLLCQLVSNELDEQFGKEVPMG